MDVGLDTLELAIWQRDLRGGDLAHHSDRGSRYPSFRYSDPHAELGITASIGSVADAYDIQLMMAPVALRFAA